MRQFFILIVLLSNHALAEVRYADKVVIDKSERKMWLVSNNIKFKEYSIALGGSPVGHKAQEGDQKTPEGSYFIDYRNPESNYHLSLHISYPNEADQAYADKLKIDPGGQIFIHGLPISKNIRQSRYQTLDWTDGCIAVSNKEIEEIWTLVKDSTPIEIYP